MKVYDPVGDIRRQFKLAELIPDPASDSVFMAAARNAVIAGGNVPWSDLQEAEAKRKAAAVAPAECPGAD